MNIQYILASAIIDIKRKSYDGKFSTKIFGGEPFYDEWKNNMKYEYYSSKDCENGVLVVVHYSRPAMDRIDQIKVYLNQDIYIGREKLNKLRKEILEKYGISI